MLFLMLKLDETFNIWLGLKKKTLSQKNLKKKMKTFYNNNVNQLRQGVSLTLHEPMIFPLVGTLSKSF